MPTAMRLKRIGAKKAPVYRIVITDSRNKRDGRSIEVLGIYNPRTNPAGVELDTERVQHWLANGAAPSDTVRSILRKAGFYRPEGPSLESAKDLQRAPSVIAGERQAGERAPIVAPEIAPMEVVPEPVAEEAPEPVEAEAAAEEPVAEEAAEPVEAEAAPADSAAAEEE